LIFSHSRPIARKEQKFSVTKPQTTQGARAKAEAEYGPSTVSDREDGREHKTSGSIQTPRIKVSGRNILNLVGKVLKHDETTSTLQSVKSKEDERDGTVTMQIMTERGKLKEGSSSTCVGGG
jgi:hypothetical protein